MLMYGTRVVDSGGAAVPLGSAEPVTSVTFEESVKFCHQFAKSG
nr:hypothetical protein [Streptomyces cyaneochromogenes]